MKRTEKKLKSKSIKTHVPSNAHAYYCYKYDRNYVAAHYADVSRLPFSQGSRRIMFMFWDEHPNVKLQKYLDWFFQKRLGQKVDDVFHEFSCLGWKSTWEMLFYWDNQLNSRWTWFFEDEDGRLQCDDDYLPHKYEFGRRLRRLQPEPEKRLTRLQLEYNESVVVPELGTRYGDCERLMGTFYVEYNHKVFKCPVYHLDFSGGASYAHWNKYSYYNKLDIRQYVPVRLLGVYRHELKFVQHHWTTKVVTTFNKKLQTLDAEVITYDIGCGELFPYAKRDDIE